jgi:hypothetical protein
MWEAIAWLAIFTAWISVFSDFLVDAIEVLYLTDVMDDFYGTYFICHNF